MYKGLGIRTKIVILIALTLLVGSSFSSVLADSQDGFDNYPAQASSPVIPLPWTYNVVTGSPSCWTGISVPALPDTGVVNLPNADQPTVEHIPSSPQAFEFNFNPSCSNTATSINISIQVNSTSSAIFLNWYQSMISVCDSGTTPACGMPADGSTKNTLQPNVVTFSVLINGVSEYSNDTSSISAGLVWLQEGIAPIVTGVTVNTIEFQITTAAYGGGSYSFSFGLDSIYFGNSNPIIVNSGAVAAYNLVLQDYATGQWYNMSDYRNSQIIVNYNQTTPCTTSPSAANPFGIGTGEPIPTITTQGSECIIANPSYPDMYIPNLGYASQLSVTVGTAENSTTNPYMRTIIPCVNPLIGEFTPDLTTCGQSFAANGTSYAGVQRVYLNPPSQVDQYTLTIDDLSGIYDVAGTQIFLYTGSLTNATVITSGYIDGQGTFPVALMPGSYIAVLRSSSGSQYETTVNAGTTSSALSIAIGSVSFSAATDINSISVGAGLTCDNTGIIVGYNDAAALTTYVTFTLENYTAGSILMINSTTESMSGTTLFHTFTGINSSQAGYYLIQANATRTNGFDPFVGPVPVTSQVTGCNGLPPAFPKTPLLPNSVFGLNQILPNPSSALQLLAFGIILLISLSMNVRTARMGVILVVGLSIVFTMAGWLPLQTFYASIFMVGSISVFLLSKARKG